MASDSLPCALHGREPVCDWMKSRGTAEHAAPIPLLELLSNKGLFLFLHIGRAERCRAVCRAKEEHPVVSKAVHLGRISRCMGLERCRFDRFLARRLRGTCEVYRHRLEIQYFRSVQDLAAAM